MFRPRIRLIGYHGTQFRAKADLPVGFPYRFNSSFVFLFFISFVYFGENNNSNVLKSLNIEHVITYITVFSICSQHVEFYKVLPQKVSDKPNGTLMS